MWQYNDVDRAFWREHLEAWLPAEIFDAHTHVNEPRFRRETMTEQKRRQYWVNEVSEPIGAAEAHAAKRRCFPIAKFSCLAFGNPSAGVRHRGRATPACKKNAFDGAGIAWRWCGRNGRPIAWPPSWICRTRWA